jgi:hypothetical protein
MLRTVCLLLTLVSYLCFAAGSPYEKEESQIPTTPSTPPLQKVKKAREIPHCERFFIYQGKQLECDSNVGRDAERLRPLMEDVPEAVAELDIYQENRRNMRYAAYLGTVSILTMIAGTLVSRPPFDANSGAIRPGGFLLLLGLVGGVNAVVWGFTASNSNERHIGNAVNYYNGAHPNRPIELQFSTQINL